MPRTKKPPTKSKRTRHPKNRPWEVKLFGSDPETHRFTTFEKARHYVVSILIKKRRFNAKLRAHTKSKMIWKGHGYKIVLKNINKKPINGNSEVAIHKPFGGHLFNPPEKCKYRRHSKDGGNWTDMGCCQKLCEAQCMNYLNWCKMKPKERNEFLRENGVLLP